MKTIKNYQTTIKQLSQNYQKTIKKLSKNYEKTYQKTIKKVSKKLLKNKHISKSFPHFSHSSPAVLPWLMRARSARRGQIQTDSNRLKQILPYTQTDSSRLKQIQQRLKQTQSYSVALPVPCYYRFFIMWEGPFSSPGGWEDFSEAEPSRAGSKVTNLHEASRKWGQISTTGAVVHKLTPTPASKIWRQFEHSSRGTGGRYGSGLGGGPVFPAFRGESTRCFPKMRPDFDDRRDSA